MISAISGAVSATHALALSGCAAPELACAHHSYLSYEDTGIPVWLRIRDTRAHHTGKSEARKLGIGDWHSELGFRGDVQLIAISNHAAQINPVPEWVIVLYLYLWPAVAAIPPRTRLPTPGYTSAVYPNNTILYGNNVLSLPATLHRAKPSPHVFAAPRVSLLWPAQS